MTAPLPDGNAGASVRLTPARYPTLAGRLAAAVETSRPRQWPKNLLVFAAPLAAASLGRDDGLGYALVAAAAFTAASAAVYFINDVADAGRDRRHPVKRSRPVASGRLRRAHALALAGLLVIAGLAAGTWIGEPRLSLVVGVYLVFSGLYSAVLKHIPVVELALVAAGFVLRALGGAVVTHVPPSGWFLLVCSLGALMVAIAKRSMELTALGNDAARHRPVLSWYNGDWLRAGQRIVVAAMVMCYLLWAHGEQNPRMLAWHLASAVALAAALARFDWLTGQATGKPVEDLIARDGVMVCCELIWLAMFTAGL
jgi:decaprenyl-phosphate phosphoribosyltransferase